MKKIQAMDEAGRGMAEKRYGAIASKSKYGHSQMGQNLSKKFQMQAGGTFPAPVRPPSVPSIPQIPANPVMPANIPPNLQQAAAASIQQNLAQRQAAQRAAAANMLQNVQARQAARAAGRPALGMPPVAAMPPTGIKRGGRVKKGK